MTGPRHEYSRSFYRGVLASLPGAALSGLLAVVSPASAQTWTQTSAPSNYWWSVASSADGSKVVAACFSSGIYTSADSGATRQQTGAQLANWGSVASSADGPKTVAAASYSTGGASP